jgi:hypothetical protein
VGIFSGTRAIGPLFLDSIHHQGVIYYVWLLKKDETVYPKTQKGRREGMPAQNYYEGIKHVVYVSTGEQKECEHCGESVGGSLFAKAVNHYIEEHGYKLLHIGTDTNWSDEGTPWHDTVAVVGK